MKNSLTIISPVYNDWESWSKLAALTQRQLATKVDYHWIIVDDGSTTSIPKHINEIPNLTIITLTRNLGHQKAIAIGLAYAAENHSTSDTLVMDADGEDKPEDILLMLEMRYKYEQCVIFAARKNRSEGILFKICYRVYKILFKILTGKDINFGNFSLIPSVNLSKIVHVSEIWNNYPGGVIISKIPIKTITLDKGNRLAGKSKMNFTSLIQHGLSAVSVHSESVSVRVLIGCGLLSFLAIIAILVVMYMRIFTDNTSPGWATTIVSGSALLIFQTFIVSLLVVFITLRGRMNRYFIPAINYKDFIKEITIV